MSGGLHLRFPSGSFISITADCIYWSIACHFRIGATFEEILEEEPSEAQKYLHLAML